MATNISKTKIFIAYDGEMPSWVIKETGVKRITRTGYHIFSTHQRLSQTEFDAIKNRYNVVEVSGKDKKITLTALWDFLEDRIAFYSRDWYKGLVGVKRQKSDVKYLEKVKDVAI